MQLGIMPFVQIWRKIQGQNHTLPLGPSLDGGVATESGLLEWLCRMAYGAHPAVKLRWASEMSDMPPVSLCAMPPTVLPPWCHGRRLDVLTRPQMLQVDEWWISCLKVFSSACAKSEFSGETEYERWDPTFRCLRRILSSIQRIYLVDPSQSMKYF